ncbi:MAG: helix-turn-helix transcriptional regulator [Atopobiaceae bacterium]|nr:helix-turn-helix transcriptional regulator [Atopobiaceae bacterium]
MLTKDELPDCPVMTTLRLIGNKWKILIIQRLLDRPYRFNELCRSIDGLSDKVLADNLKQLERDGIITRTVFPEVPVRVEYALSETGESMRPIIASMSEWGSGYQEQVRRLEE